MFLQTLIPDSPTASSLAPACTHDVCDWCGLLVLSCSLMVTNQFLLPGSPQLTWPLFTLSLVSPDQWHHEAPSPLPRPRPPRPGLSLHAPETRQLQGRQEPAADQDTVWEQGVQWVLPGADRQLCDSGQVWHFQVRNTRFCLLWTTTLCKVVHCEMQMNGWNQTKMSHSN